MSPPCHLTNDVVGRTSALSLHVRHLHIHALSGVRFTGYMNELRHDCPRLSYTYIYICMSWQGWATWGISLTGLCTQNTSMVAGCELYSIAYPHIHVFRGWTMGYEWGSSWSVWRVQNYDRDQRVALQSILTLVLLRCSASNPSISFPITRSV